MPERFYGITDDRGAHLAMRDCEPSACGVSVGGLRERSVLSRQTGLEKAALAISIVSMTIASFVVYAFVPGVWYIFALLAVMGSHMILLWLVSMRSRGVKIRRAAVVALESGRCPGCRYELVDLPVENDGCTVCSECGAAWQAHRIGTGIGRDAPTVRGARGGVASLLALFGGFSQPDALGRPTYGPPLVAVRMIRASKGTGRARDLSRAVQDARRSGLVPRAACAGLLLVAAAVAVMTLRPTSALFGIPIPPLGWFISVLTSLILALLLFGSDAFVARRARITALLSAAFCPTCGCDLRGCARDGEMLTCPECGATWQLGA
jgi:hypothetical protein